VLVLTRRAGESVVIGDDIRVTVVEVRGDVVRLGIDAPRDVKVHREEVHRAVSEANAAAAAASDDDIQRLAAALQPKLRRGGGEESAE
jgi:carbon storage regulator